MEKVIMSDSINELASALCKFQGDVKQPKKNRTVKMSGTTRSGKAYDMSYNYATLDECIASTKDARLKHGISITQLVSNSEIVTILMHDSGQWIQCNTPINIPANIQDYGKIITYMRRYTYCSILGLAAEEDNDCSDIAQRQEDCADNSDVIEQWKAAIESCTTQEQLADLWRANKDAVSDPTVKKMFTARKKSIQQTA